MIVQGVNWGTDLLVVGYFPLRLPTGVLDAVHGRLEDQCLVQRPQLPQQPAAQLEQLLWHCGDSAAGPAAHRRVRHWLLEDDGVHLSLIHI